MTNMCVYVCVCKIPHIISGKGNPNIYMSSMSFSRIGYRTDMNRVIKMALCLNYTISICTNLKTSALNYFYHFVLCFV